MTDPIIEDEEGLDAQRSWRLVLRRSAALAGGEVAARVAGFFVVLILARRLDPEGLGIVTLGLTLVGAFALVVDAGTETLTMRDVARRPQEFRHIAERVLGLRLALSLVAAVIFVIGVQLFARSEAVRSTVTLFVFLLPAIALNLRWMVLGVGGVRAIALGNMAARVVALIGALLLVANEDDVRRVPFLELGAELAYALVIAVFVFTRKGPIRPRVDLAVWRTTLSQSSPLMANAAARAARMWLEVILIEVMLGPADLGIYAVATKPSAFVAGMVAIFSLSFLAAFSATAPTAAAAVHWRAQRALLLVSVPSALVLALASPLLPFVFGDAFEESGVVLAVMAWRLPFVALGNLYAQVLIAQHRQRAVMNSNIIATVVVTAAEIPAILAFGLVGAAALSVVGFAIVLGLNYRVLRSEFPELLRNERSEP